MFGDYTLRRFRRGSSLRHEAGDSMLIDFHVHAFPDRLAERALAVLAKNIASPPLTDGTLSGTLAAMDRWGVDRAVICNIATNPKQTANVNAFAAETLRDRGDRFTPLGSVHPDLPDPEPVLRGLAEAGIPGIKLHPDYMRRTVDDPCYDVIFEICASLGLFVLTHAGFDVYSTSRVFASPDRLLRRLERSPKTVLIAAHYGGNMMWDEVEEKICGKDLYIDTSLGGLTKLSPEQAARILAKHDPEKILFGSDCPWCSSAETFRYVDALPLSGDLKEKIFHGNAERLLGLK